MQKAQSLNNAPEVTTTFCCRDGVQRASRRSFRVVEGELDIEPDHVRLFVNTDIADCSRIAAGGRPLARGAGEVDTFPTHATPPGPFALASLSCSEVELPGGVSLAAAQARAAPRR